MHPGFARHIASCNNAALPGRRLPFRVAGTQVGWILPEIAAAFGSDCTQEALPGLGRRLHEAGHAQWRDEAFDVRASAEGPVLATVDRGALPVLGIAATGVHLNGLVRRADGLHLWVARRAADKKLDPGKLDHIAAGGVAAGMGVRDTLAKEAEEEAGLQAALVAQAEAQGVIEYAMERPEGLRRDRLHCFDLWLPEDLTPTSMDGEVAAFELWPIARAVATVRETDEFKFNVNLVLIELFARLGLLEG